MLRCEINTPEMEEEVVGQAADAMGLPEDELQADFEHGQWWVTHLPSGAQWSANDAAGDEFIFEQVTDGDEEVLAESREETYG